MAHCASMLGADVSSRQDAASAPVLTRLCESCGEPIPRKRLEARPDAQQCAPCLEMMGDVPRLRRFDEFCGEDTVSTLYTRPSQYLRSAMRHLNGNPANDISYYEAVGDDSHLEKPETRIDSADTLTSAFEADPVTDRVQ